jgi:phosphoribosyl 1,2-cyclic phosphodiesterase/CheY-like chemotaxis protein
MRIDLTSRPMRVIVVDDDPNIRAIISQILVAEGYRVQAMESADGIECAIGDFGADVILCDLLMPGRDGITVCRSLQADPEAARIPFILISAKSFEGDKRAALDAGAAGYLVKPFSPDALISAISEALTVQPSVTVWGCRGSIAAPEQARGIYGGNTSCIDLVLPGRRHLIFDAGTGIRSLGNELLRESPLRIALFLTHFHWDHVQGLPFFKPLYVPGNEVTIHGPAQSSDALVDTIEGQMGGAFFPTSTEVFRSSVKWVGLQEQTLDVGDVTVSTLHVLHPGTTLAYRVDFDGRSLVYAPDNELLPETVSPELSAEALRLATFAAGADLLVHDCQYSAEKYEQRRGWGHSSGKALAAVAARAQVQRVLLFHHDPDSEDADVEAVRGEFCSELEALGVEIIGDAAREGFTYLV